MILPGSRLGPYEIVASIGAGGMGEVFRARDTRLNRDVAVKILPADFAGSAQLHARFDREAKAIAALNHPNICVVHDVGHEEETHYLVMELLDGESLVDRLRRGPLSMPEVLRYGQQIASALDKAHRQGIIHRDLKPGNIMLTRTGAKLLDFGLAKISESAPSTQSMATAQKPITEQGAILGTFQYMAPEQLEGLDADPRTDIFALGAVMYEMATGKRAFQGSSRTSLIAAIVASQPQAISELVPMTPPAFEHVVRRCLEKNPDDRWQSAQDVASELQWVGEVTASGTHAIPAAIARPKWRKFAAPALIVVALLAGAAAGWSLRRPAAVQSNAPPVRSEVPLPAGTRLFGWGSPSIAISPDGQAIAYVGIDAQGPQRLYIRHLSQSDLQGVPVLVSASGAEARWSPDGKEIVFRNGDQVLAAPFGGGDPGEPRALFKVEGLKTFDVIPGSTDFALIVEEAGSGVKTRISMVQNWVF
jgi:eukaryotic-like serine/threonine-protein kinase